MKDNPTHPGETVRDVLHDSGMTATELAAALGVGRGNLYRLLRGQIVLTPRTAVALERIGWSTAEFWCRWQASYDLAQIRRETAAALAPAAESEPDGAPAAPAEARDGASP